MSIDDRILSALQYGPRRKKYIIFFLIIAVPALTLMAFPLLTALLFWLFYARAKLYADYFRGSSSYSSAASALAGLGEVAQHQRSGTVKLEYRKRLYGIRASEPFLVLFEKPNALIITPARYWSRRDDGYTSGDSENLMIRPIQYGKETLTPSSRDEVISSRWAKQTKSGDRDYRYKENDEVFTVQRFGIKLILANGTEWSIAGLTDMDHCLRLANQFSVLTGAEVQKPEGYAYSDDADEEQVGDDEDADYSSNNSHSEKEWYEILGVAPGASNQLIKQARDNLLRGLHPDRLKSIEGLNPDIEKYATARLVEVNLAYEEAMRSRGEPHD